MPHVLINGMTESGKTTLAKRLAAKYKESNVGVIVLDPLHDPQWQADFQTADPDEFLSVVRQSQRCAVFIDEAGESVGQFDKQMHWLATRARHYGHNSHFLSQRGAQLAKTVRDQCSRLFLFCSSLDDCKIHAREWNKEELKQANSLAVGEYFATGRFTDCKRYSLFGKNRANSQQET